MTFPVLNLGTAETDAEPVLDRDTALARVGGDADLLREIGLLFLQEYPREITELRTAVGQRDAHRIERRAHSLKGSIATFGSGLAFETAFALERQGRAGDLTDVEENLDRFESVASRLCTEIQAFIGE